MDWKQRTQTLNLLSFMSLSRSLSFSARASLSKARAAIIRPLPILRAAPRRRLSFSLFSRGLIGRRVWGASAALPWHPPPKLRRCGLRMTSRSSSFNRSRGSEDNSEELRSVHLQKIFKNYRAWGQTSYRVKYFSDLRYTGDSSFQRNSLIHKVFLKTVHWRTTLWSGVQWGVPFLRVPDTITVSKHQHTTCLWSQIRQLAKIAPRTKSSG